MNKVITYLRNEILTKKETSIEYWKRLFIYACIIGILNVVFRFINISSPIQYIIIFLTGAAYSFNQNRYINSLICGLSFFSLIIIQDYIFKYFFITNAEQLDYSSHRLYLFICILSIVPYVVLGIIANLKFSIKYLLLGFLGSVFCFLFLETFYYYSLYLDLIVFTDNTLPVIIPEQLKYNLFIISYRINPFLFPLIISFSINPGFIKFLFTVRYRLNRIQFIIPYLILALIQSITTFLIFFSFYLYFNIGVSVSSGIHLTVIPIYFIISVILLIGNISLSIKRLHDSNHSGWWILLAFLPVANLYLMYLLLFKKGDIGENRYDNISYKNFK